MPLRVGLVAGESSGDLLGAGLIRALRRRRPDTGFEGVAGPHMIEAGCEKWADSDRLAVMGLIEPLRHLPDLLRLRRELATRWRASPPDVFVGIDSPDFNLGLELSARLGWSSASLGADKDQAIFAANVKSGWSPSSGRTLLVSGFASGRWGARGHENVRVGGEVRYFLRNFGR